MSEIPHASPLLHPLSSVQREIWFDQALCPDKPIYNIGGYTRIDGPLDLEAFRQAATLLAQETESLRLRLCERNGEPFQTFPDMPRVDVELCDCSGEADPLQAAFSRMLPAVQEPFRLNDESLFRWSLYRLSETCSLWFHRYHHLVIDGYAVSLITQRVAALYGALSQGEPIPARPGVSYLEFVEADAAYLKSDAHERHRQYWQRKFSTPPEPLHARKTEYASRADIVPGEAHTWFISRPKYAQLEALAQAGSVSVFHVLLGLLYVYFTRVQDRDEFVIGLPVLNRSTHAFKQTIGLFASVIPARFSFGREIGFVGLVQAIARCLREDYRCQRFPVSEITRLSGALKEGKIRLFDLTLSFESHDYGTRFGAHCTCQTVAFTNGYEQMPLAVFVREFSKEHDIQVDFTYNLAYFDAEEIKSIQRRFAHLMEAVIVHPEQSVADLDILPPAEKRQLLVEWNDTAVPLPSTCAHELIEEQAARHPAAPAVVFEGKTLSYGELNAQANRLARHLLGLGLLREEPVAIALERSPAMIVAVLAVLKAGGAFVPLDPDYPAERLAFMLEDSAARFLLTQDALLGRLPPHSGRILCLDAEADLMARQPESDLGLSTSPEQLAYIIYTSGSTGRPKGTALVHRGLSNLIPAIASGFGVTSRSRVLQFASFSFDASVLDITVTLCSGAALYLPNADQRMPGEFLLKYLAREGITLAILPPTALAALPKAALPALECLVVAGEACPPDLAVFWSKGRRFLNGYGPTETTVCATVAECTQEDIAGTTLPIGRPIANTRLYVLDRHLQPVPIGVPGELHIGGVGLARGYLNRPELTAEKFIPDPFDGEPGARLYRTGDLVRYRPDGNLMFLGRLDDQVKVRGFRIELGEIESVLAAHPGVREAVVVARKDERGEPSLAAYVVSSPSQAAQRSFSAADLRAFVQAKLPHYMVPASFVFLEALPLSPNGKVDRKALPDPREQVLSADVTAARDALEETVAGSWARVLRRETVGIHDNFFELGGHSLLATQIASHLRAALAVDIPVRWMFETLTVAELAARLRPLLAGKGEAVMAVPENRLLPGTTRITPDLLPLVDLTQTEIDQIVSSVEGGAGNVQDVYPLAPLQEGILFHHQLQASSDAYLSWLTLRFDSAAQRTAFIDAFQAIVGRHDILRTAIVWEGLSRPVQVVWRRARIAVESLTLDSGKGPAAGQLLQYCRQRHARLDLTRAPLLRFIHADDGGAFLLHLLAHHLLVDHAALEFLLKEIAASRQDKIPDRVPPVPFRNFVAEACQRNAPALHEAFFRDMLGDVQTPTTPFGLRDVKGDGSAIAEARRTLPAELALRLRAQVRLLGATPAALCHLAWALVLSRICGQDDVVFGTVLFGRLQGGEGIERAMGLFINTLPFRITCDERRVDEALRQTQTSLLALLRHEHASLSQAQRCSAVPGGLPLFSSILNYRHSLTRFEDLGPLLGFTVLKSEERSNYPLGISIDDLGEGFDLIVQVDESVDPERICAMMQCALESLVDAMEGNPRRLLSELDLLPPGERRKLLADWNSTEAPIPAGCVHEMFEEQAGLRGEAAAVIQEDEALSYRELNARANRLARRLMELGVCADQPVAIALKRSPAMIVAVLATLKAGGPFVPLDPDYPAERLAFMLEDSGARLILTQSALLGRLPQSPGHTLCLDAEEDLLARQSGSNLGLQVAAGQLAYIIYTSGSTGKPKGTALVHRGLSNLARAQILAFGLKPESRVLQFASFSFDASVSEVMMALCSGAVLCLPNDEQRLPGRPLLDHLAEAGITHVTLPPTALAALPRADLPRLESLIVAGEACPPNLAAFWAKGRRFFNAYGPTETTVCATIAECTREDLAGTTLPIGRPIANTRLYVLGPHLQPVPLGVPGELHIGGLGLARGYLNRPELTAEKFIPDPFSGEPGARLYRTGDLVRYREDGNLEFLGRMDQQVKLRGFRIELGEIEAVLTSHPKIRESVVTVRNNENADSYLAAYLVSTEGRETGAQPSAGDLRDFLKMRLPDYMLPAVFVFLDVLPLTLNGKVDRKALPEPEAGAPARVVATSRDALEELLVGLWAMVLGQGAVGVHDNFFELGGHSLLATQLATRLRDALGIAVPVSWIFEAPSAAELADRLRPLLAGEQTAESPGISVPANRILPGTTRITPDLLPLIVLSQAEIDRVVGTVDGGAVNVQDLYPLTPLQEGILFHHRLRTSGDAYLSHALLSFDSSACRTAFLDAFQAVMDRHDILRSAFVWEQVTEPVQVVWRKARLPVETVSLDPAGGTAEMQLLEYLHKRHSRLELTKAPLVHASIADAGERSLLLFLFHHLIMDHATLEVLIDEIAAVLQGRMQELAPPVLFRAFVADSRHSDARDAHEAFFQRMLGDIETPTAPFGLLNVRGDGSAIAEAELKLPAELALSLRLAAKRQGATPAALCHLAWALVLSRCCGQDEVVFGTVFFGRLQGGMGIERALGLFINTLPFRITCDARPVSEVLRQTQQNLLALMGHEHAPLSLAQRCSRVPAGTPLFSSLLNYRHSQVLGKEAFRVLGLEILKAEERSNYPFDMSVDDLGGDGFALNAQVDGSVDPGRICAYMQCALESLVAALRDAPQTPFCRLGVLPPAERWQLLVGWNPAAVPLPEESCVHHGFEARAAENPDATALYHEDETLSYTELNARANRLAHALISLGVVPDATVAIALERSPAMIVALLATLKAGGAAVPLDPDYPAERLASMIEDSGAQIVVTLGSLRSRLPHCSGHVLCLDAEEGALARQPVSNPRPAVSPHHLAYIIYTSGSTGRAKGVAVEHHSIARHCEVIRAHYELTPGDRILQFASFSFDASMEQVLPELCAGAAIVLPAPGLHTPESVEACVQRFGVTVLDLPPAFFRLWSVFCGARISPLLRLIILGGDVLPPEALKIRDRWPAPGPRVINAYGPTEATITSTCYDVPAMFSGASVPIGRALPHRTLYVLDRHLQPAPLGVPGELLLGGACLARGYLSRPELTAEKFIPDPFSEAPGARLYRTGDLVRYRTDGNLEFLGRMDRQVKLRGFRIELGEIEAALASHPALGESTVTVRKDSGGEPRLAAYVVARGSEGAQARLSQGDLRDFLKSRLPAHMVPADVVFMEALPLLPNGKVDRKALPEPDVTASIRKGAVPRDDLEEICAGLWAEVLHLDAVGIHDNFFELGGHSLLATQISSRLHEALGIAVPVRWLFEAPTIAELAARIRTVLAGDAGGEKMASPVPANLISPETTRITPELLPLITLSQTEIDRIVDTVEGGVENVQDIYPLAPLQEGLFFHYLLQKTGDAYLSSVLLSLDSRAGCEAILSDIQAIIERHDALRIAIAWEGLSVPAQVVWRQARLAVEFVDVDPARGPAADQLLAQYGPEFTRLDLTRPPLMRVVLAQDGERTLLLLLSHHLVMDHVSSAVLMNELSAYARGEEKSLPAPVPYRNFVAEALREFSSDIHETFFREMLGDVETPTAPFGLLDVLDDDSTLVEENRLLPVELAQGLRSQARRLGATPAALFHLAWALVLSRCCGQDDVVTGTVLLGRHQGGEGIDRAMGLFINTLPIRLVCDGRPVEEDLRETQRRLLALMRHEHTTLGLAQRCSHVPSPTPLFSSLLNYRHSFERGLGGLLRDGVQLVHAYERTNFPVVISVDDFGDGFGVTAQVDASLDPDRICAFMQTALESLLKALVEAPGTPLWDLEILPPAERRQLLLDWNTTASPLPAESCLHEAFERQAARRPDAVALIHGERTLSTAELNERANRLAHALIARGVTDEAPVAILLERSPALIVALLATLKAGAAYVPLDPAYPVERLAFMLEDSGARVLITQETLRSRLPQAAAFVLCLDGEAAAIAAQPAVNPGRHVARENLAYIIYTSGSTGKPKGVQGLHGSTLNRIAWMQDTYPFGEGEVCVQKTSLSFVDSVCEIFGPLLHGVPLVILPDALAKDPLAMISALAEQRISRLVLVPSLLRVLLDEVDDLGARLPQLRVCVSSGEALPSELAQRFLAAIPHATLLNLYGSTEVAGDATCARVSAGDKQVFIGRPIANTRLYVLDRHLHPAPIGVPGELFVGGAGLARGYLNRPELTAEKFIPDPFSVEPGARLFRTGDLVRYKPDGNLEYLGRLDHQVKIRGFRIELGEIEAVLAEHQAIRECVVGTRTEDGGSQRLVAYIVLSSGEAAAPRPSLGDLRGFLKAKLPDHMLPTDFVFLEALPLTPNGKVDRKALPGPEDSSSMRAAVAPRDALEELLVGHWAAVLTQETVGIHDNFFELGGHSLLATQLSSRLHDALAITIPVRWFFDAPTVAELADCIRRRLEGGPEGDTAVAPVPENRIAAGTARITPELLPLITLSQIEIDRIVDTVEGGAENVQDIYPLAPLQEGLFFHHLLHKTEDIYLCPVLLSFDSRSRVELVLSALRAVTQRHDAMRTAIVWEGLSEPVQVVWRRVELPVEFVDIDPAGGAADDQLFEQFHMRFKRLDLNRAPLLRILLAQDGERMLMLLITHHLIMDLTSNQVLTKELEAHLKGEEKRLPPPVPFRNFVANAAGTLSAAGHEAYFRELLGDIEKPTLPFGLVGVPEGRSMMATDQDRLPSALSHRLRLLARRHFATPAAVFHLAWALVLSRCCEQEKVVFGTVLLGRHQGGSDVENAVGMLINTLPVRIDYGEQSAVDGLKKTQRQLLALLSHEQAPLSMAQRCSAVTPHLPLFSSVLNYRHNHATNSKESSIEGIGFVKAEGRSHYPLSLSVDELNEDFSLGVEVHASIDPKQINAMMLNAVSVLLEALENNPKCPLKGLEIATIKKSRKSGRI